MKNIFQNIKENLKLIIGVLVIGIFLGWLFFHPGGEATQQVQEIEGHEGHDHESEDPTTWTCSMHPQIKQDKPGQCPICAMDLIPLVSMNVEGDVVDPNEITMTESAAKLAEIQTMIVAAGTPQKSIRLQGKIQEDERRISELTARFGGRIEKLFVNFTGQNVQKGEKLATIYSPELIAAQRELLEAMTYKETRPALYNAAIGKLRLWNLTDAQINSIEKNGEPLLYFDVLSPISGTVTMRHVAIGDYVKEGTALFKVVDLTRVWALFDAYETDLPWIKTDDKIEFTIQSLPGKIYSGKVSFIDPFLHSRTRVAKVRVELKNAKFKIKPEMFTTGILQSKIADLENEILIPKTALLWTGKRAVVYVKVPERENPSFLYREIILGPEAGNFYVVADGLNEGEEIAVNGVFKIDAASQLQGLPSMMNPDGGTVSTGHNHGGTKMTDEQMKEMEKAEAKSASFSKNVPDKFKNQLGNIIKAYLKMKDSFVATDEAKVEKDTKFVLSELNKVDMGLLKGDAHSEWMKLKKPIKDNLNGIVRMKGIEMRRSHFSVVSDKLTKAIDLFGIKSNQPVYLEFCPMAFDDKGAFWISSDKEIKNPYFGDKMLKCGEVKRELK